MVNSIQIFLQNFNRALSGGGNEIADQFIGDGVVTNWQRKFTASGDLKMEWFQRTVVWK